MIISDINEYCKLLPKTPVIMAIDYGTKKVGIAISIAINIAVPLKVIQAADDIIKIQKISEVILEKKISGIVIGVPLSMDGTNNKQVTLIQTFASRLSVASKLPIYLQDERCTSKAANNLLKSFGMRRKQRNIIDDSVAASMILETALHCFQLTSYL